MSRQPGYNHTPEVKERIGKGVSHARHASSIQTQEYYRSKIKTTQILNALGRIANGEVEGKPNQVAAATVLLRKVLPDLQSVELRGNGARTTLIITGVVRAEDLERSSPSLPEMKDVTPK